jgi:hypothetical protein
MPMRVAVKASSCDVIASISATFATGNQMLGRSLTLTDTARVEGCKLDWAL